MTARPLYVSTCAFTEPNLGDALARAESWGATHVELSSGLPHDPGQLALVRARRNDFTFLTHNYFPAPETPFVLNLASTDPAILRTSRDHCLRNLDLAAELNAPFYAAHAGLALDPDAAQLGRTITAEAGRMDRARDIFAESVTRLLDAARSRGVGFLIENNVVSPVNLRNGANSFLLMAETSEIIDFAAMLGRDDFGILMDVAHLKVSARTLGFAPDKAMEALLPLIRALHLSDNDGTADTNRPFGSEAWFLPWLAKLPGAALVLESCRLDETAFRSCRDAVAAAA